MANSQQGPPNPGTFIETLDLCGESITVTAVQQPGTPEISLAGPVSDPTYVIPPINLWDFGGYRFQTTKTVSDSNPIGGDSVTYTITVVNRFKNVTPMFEIIDILPVGFSYDCAAPPDQLTLPGMAPQGIAPNDGPCPAGNEITWSMPSGTNIATGE